MTRRALPTAALVCLAAMSSAAFAQTATVTYVLDDNQGGFAWFRLDFSDGDFVMALEDVDGPIEVTAAFDGRFHESEAWGRPWAFRPVWTDDESLAREIRSLRVHGDDLDSDEPVRIGINSRFDTIQAAVLLEKLAIFTDEIEARNNVAARYTQALGNIVDAYRLRCAAA